MKDILNQSTKASVNSHTPNEKRYGKGHIRSNDKRSHDSNCRKTPAVNTMFVDTDSAMFNIYYKELYFVMLIKLNKIHKKLHN